MRKTLVLLLVSLFLFSSSAFDKTKRAVFDELRLIMTKQEEKAFKSIKTQEELQNFVKEFWKKRDSDPSTPENETKNLYYERLRAAEKYFREAGRKGWLTDRGRIFVILGPPNKRDMKMMSPEEASSISNSAWRDQGGFNITSTGNLNGEVWYYDNLKLVLVFLDEKRMGQYRLINPPPELLDYLERAKKRFLPGNTMAGENLPISADADVKGKKLYIHIPLQALLYKKEKGNYMADIELGFFYTNLRTNMQKSFTQEMKFSVKEKDIKDPEKRVTIPINLGPLKGTYIIDIVIKDKISGKTGKKRYKLKI